MQRAIPPPWLQRLPQPPSQLQAPPSQPQPGPGRYGYQPQRTADSQRARFDSKTDWLFETDKGGKPSPFTRKHLLCSALQNKELGELMQHVVLMLNIVEASAWAFALFYFTYLLKHYPSKPLPDLNQSLFYRFLLVVCTGAGDARKQSIVWDETWREVIEAFAVSRGGRSAPQNLTGLGLGRCITLLAARMEVSAVNHLSSNIERYLRQYIMLFYPRLKAWMQGMVQAVVEFPGADLEETFRLASLRPGEVWVGMMMVCFPFLILCVASPGWTRLPCCCPQEQRGLGLRVAIGG